MAFMGGVQANKFRLHLGLHLHSYLFRFLLKEPRAQGFIILAHRITVFMPVTLLYQLKSTN